MAHEGSDWARRRMQAQIIITGWHYEYLGSVVARTASAMRNLGTIMAEAMRRVDEDKARGANA